MSEKQQKDVSSRPAGRPNRQIEDRMLQNRMRDIGLKLLVLSGKGGQGSDSPGGQAFESIVGVIMSGRAGRYVEAKTDSNGKETHSMKIAIPLAAGRLSMHFGHCEQFAILEVDEQNKTVTNTTLHEAPAHEPGALPRWLHEQSANVIIAGGMGQRAQQLFAQNGITVVVGAPADSPEAIAQAYLTGTLQAGENICDH